MLERGAGTPEYSAQAARDDPAGEGDCSGECEPAEHNRDDGAGGSAAAALRGAGLRRAAGLHRGLGLRFGRLRRHTRG